MTINMRSAAFKEEREIRRKRRAIKKAEREKRRAEHLARKTRRERVRNGGPIVVPAQDPTFASMRTYCPLYFCEECRGIKRSDFMFNEEICLACRDGTRRPRMKLKTTHPEPLPDEDTRKTEYAGELFSGVQEKSNDEDH